MIMAPMKPTTAQPASGRFIAAARVAYPFPCPFFPASAACAVFFPGSAAGALLSLPAAGPPAAALQLTTAGPSRSTTPTSPGGGAESASPARICFDTSWAYGPSGFCSSSSCRPCRERGRGIGRWSEEGWVGRERGREREREREREMEMETETETETGQGGQEGRGYG